MVTRSAFVKILAELTGWPERDLHHRDRWLAEAGMAPKGKGGPGGVNAAIATPDYAALLILSLACPNAKASPEFVKFFAETTAPVNAKTKYSLLDEFKFAFFLKPEPIFEIPKRPFNAKDLMTLKDYFVDQIVFWTDKERIDSSDVFIGDVTFTYSENWPMALVSLYYKEDKRWIGGNKINFAPDDKLIPEVNNCPILKSIVMPGTIFNEMANIFYPDTVLPHPHLNAELDD